jgi:hypothetical protein
MFPILIILKILSKTQGLKGAILDWREGIPAAIGVP